MKQVIQNFKTGDLYVDDLPIPSITKGFVLVENKHSLISAGTERGTVKVGKANLIGKAKQRPDLVAQVIQNVKKEGIKATLSKVKTKLDSLKALGYSTAGEIKATMDTRGFFKPGDRVACAGQDYATHSEVVSVPQNLVAKIPDNVSYKEASFTTLGAIALQGVRQAEPNLGDNVGVIGLGLLGQITCQLLKANGCNVFGIDLSKDLVDLASKLGASMAINRTSSNLIKVAEDFTNGYGFDSVIIAAATTSNDPIELSSELLRKKGKIVVVGAIKMDIPRNPYFYRKELDLRMSCSYGPGRYDTSYEEDGIDYPHAYVRWTEQRNMEAFLRLVSSGALNLKELISHEFDISDAEKAYDIVLGKNREPHIGILISYSENDKKWTRHIVNGNEPIKSQNIGFIGAGSFAQSYLIPNVKNWGASLDTVVTSKGITAKNVSEKFAFNICSTDPNEILKNPNITTIFIATPHNSHSQFVIEGLKAGKHVFVEKPLALNLGELEQIRKQYETNSSILMVGFNRRFAKISRKIKDEFQNLNEPLIMNFRINAGFIPKDHWTQNKSIGGGRVIGEMCHFIDLMQYFTDSEPVKVFADCIDSNNSKIKTDDNIIVCIKFKNGSVGNLAYIANGDKSLPKERIEVFGGGKVGIINNFRNGEIFKGGKVSKLNSTEKGHKEEIFVFLDAIKYANKSPIHFDSIYKTTLSTYKILDSLSTGKPQDL